MITRRSLLALVALVPLVPLTGCAASAAPAPAPAPATAAPAAAASEAVVVFAPGALAAHTKALAAAYQAGGRAVSFEVGHTPVQREQLAKGATPDVWIAANPADMAAAAEAGLVDAGGVRQLARTRLVVVVAPGNPGGVSSFGDLGKPGLKVLLGAATIPIGAATDKTLAKAEATQGAGFRARVEGNVVSRELGVQPIVNKVTLGEADAGIVFVTDVPPDARGVTTVTIPDAENTEVPLSIAPVTAGVHKDGAAAFLDFVTTGPGRQLLADAGYLPPAA